MNIIWNLVFFVGMILLIFINPSESLNTLFSAGEKTVTLCLSLLGIYAFWLGILQILEDCGVSKYIGIFLSPLIRFLFGDISPAAKEQIAINLSSNLFGMGNASTPSGMKAMEYLDDKTGKISEAMTMLMVLNCLSLQIMPTTIMGMRILAGSNNPASIILPTIATSVISMFFSVVAVKLWYRIKRGRA